MSYQQLKKRTEGFTIIEVLIVLAIAALIMLIVFLAIPALRRNQTNTQMRAEASRVLSGATEYESNANGNQVTTAAQMSSIYDSALNGTPAANRKLVSVTLGGGAPAGEGNGRLVVGTCVGNVATAAAGRTYALDFVLAGGTIACIQS